MMADQPSSLEKRPLLWGLVWAGGALAVMALTDFRRAEPREGGR